MLLSICIPTYNRPEALKNCLQSILESATFKARSDVEIVISDNSEDDASKDLVLKSFGLSSRLRYNKNDSNIGVANLKKCLTLGVGFYRKMSNDTVLWSDAALKTLLLEIESQKESKPLVFMKNANVDGLKIVRNNNLDGLISLASIDVTWIGGFGLWATDVDEYARDFDDSSGDLLPHTYHMLRMVARGRPCSVLVGRFFQVQYADRKGGYSLPRVFGDVYIGYLKHFGASVELVDREVWVSFRHVVSYQFNPSYDFYKAEFYDKLGLYMELPGAVDEIWKARNQFSSRCEGPAVSDRQKLWRFLNPHNATRLAGDAHPKQVFVGRYSYGTVKAMTWGSEEERLQIGCFVSISEQVTFLLGGEHPYKGISTYPFKVNFFKSKREAKTKGRIEIGDDVWIGWGALITSGVKIGQGAVVGAGAVVVSNVPPYAIVAGNPARVIRYRFANEVVERLLRLNWWRVSREVIDSLGEGIYENISPDNADAMVARLDPSAVAV